MDPIGRILSEFSVSYKHRRCFRSPVVRTSPAHNVSIAAIDLFATTHNALQFGNAELGLNTEQKLDVLAALAMVDKNWAIYAPLLQEIMEKRAGSADQIASLNTAGLDVLGVMNTAVGKIAAAYGEDLEDLPLTLVITIDLAGRQRMFT